MAELTGKAISELPESTTIVDSALVALSQNGASKKMTLATLVGNLLKKTGDTISGGALFVRNASSTAHQGRIVINNPEITFDQSHTENVLGEVMFDDSNTGLFKASIYGNYTAANTCQIIMRSRNLHDGNAVLNSLGLSVLADGSTNVDINQPAAWRKALGLCYAVNDTQSSPNTGMVISGLVDVNPKIIFLEFFVPKSMENISTVTCTAMSGHFAGVNGAVDSTTSATSYIASPYSVACVKQSNHHVRIAITKTSDWGNVSANTPVTYFGSLTLKFT